MTKNELIEIIDQLEKSIEKSRKAKDSIAEKETIEALPRLRAILLEMEEKEQADKIIAESPKPIAKPIPPLSQAKSVQGIVLKSTTEKVPVPKSNTAFLKISNHFAPKSRFYSFQKKVRNICRLLKQYNNLKSETKISKKESYRKTLKSLCLECENIVNSSVVKENRERVLSEKYKAWGTDKVFTLEKFDVFLEKFL